VFVTGIVLNPFLPSHLEERHRMRISKTLITAGLMAMLAGSQSARADFVYSSTVNAVNTFGEPDPGTTPPAGALGTVTVDVGHGNSLLFTSNFPPPTTSGTVVDIPGGSDITFGHVSFLPSATDNTVTDYAVNFNFQLTIKDLASGNTGIVNYTGRESGAVSGGGGTTAINSAFLFAVAPAELTLGNLVYQFSADAPTPPGSTGGVQSDGAFSMNISTRAVPEPGSIALLGTGLTGMGLMARRRLKKSQAMAA